MKLVNLLIGFVIFSVVATTYLTTAGFLGSEYGSRDYANYQEMSGSYNVMSDVDPGNESSYTSSIIGKVQGAFFSVVGTDSVAKDVLDGIKIMFNSPQTALKIANQVTSDVGLIDPLFSKAVRIGFAIIILIVVVSMIWRFKPDTE